MDGQLRFAPLIRVSTEGQAAKGESLRTQKSQIEQYVKLLGGIVSADGWTAYSGQEHATPDQERRKLDHLLQDAAKGRFDAVIVADASRWSRDNRKSKEGLEVLRRNGVRFFTGTTEHNLHSPEAVLFLGMAAEIGEYQARTQALKSMHNRIERAKRGLPSAGKLPYGRMFDKKAETWSIDPEKKSRMEWAAAEYLSGRSIVKLAKQFGMNHTSLWKTLSQRCGEDWEIRFRSKSHDGIDETITIKIPPLLPPEVIAAIQKQSAGNKTYTHGHLKYQYLLSRVVFCAECGYAMFGQTNHGNRRYYRHPRGRVKECRPGLWVPAEDLENAVMINLFAMFGDIERLENAVNLATPDQEQIERLSERLKVLEKEKEKIKQQKARIVDAIADGLIRADDARAKMEAARERELVLDEEKNRYEAKLEALPDFRRQLASLSQMVRKVGGEMLAWRPERLAKMTYEAKKTLVQTAFGGVDRDGNRLGVYVRKDEAGVWRYDIRGLVPMESFYQSGMLPLADGTLPMTKSQAQIILGVETDYSDFNPLVENCEEGTKYNWR